MVSNATVPHRPGCSQGRRSRHASSLWEEKKPLLWRSTVCLLAGGTPPPRTHRPGRHPCTLLFGLGTPYRPEGMFVGVSDLWNPTATQRQLCTEHSAWVTQACAVHKLRVPLNARAAFSGKGGCKWGITLWGDTVAVRQCSWACFWAQINSSPMPVLHLPPLPTPATSERLSWACSA